MGCAVSQNFKLHEIPTHSDITQVGCTLRQNFLLYSTNFSLISMQGEIEPMRDQNEHQKLKTLEF